MGTKQDRVTVRFDGETMAQLEGLAEAKNMPVAGVVRAACDLYIKDQKLGAELEGVEARLAASIVRTQDEIDQLGKRVAKAIYRAGDDIQLVIALIDQLARFQFITTPEVIDHDAANAVGNRRHEGFISELHKAFSSRKRKAVISTQLEEMGEAPAEQPGDTGLEMVDSDEIQGEDSPGDGRLRLTVPFAEKDRAKAAGAVWDKEAKAFFAPPGADLAALQEWMPKE